MTIEILKTSGVSVKVNQQDKINDAGGRKVLYNLMEEPQPSA